MMQKIILFSLLSLIAISCKKKGCTDETATNYNTEAKKDDGSCEYTNLVKYEAQINQIRTTYANMADAAYSDALATAIELKNTCAAFTANPTDQNFTAAKTAWLNARESYGQTEIFRFVEGPIDNYSDGPEGLINAWPLDEAYIDYVQGSTNSGIINNLTNYPAINITTLVTANENGGEANISTGYHAIEFLLWGQDLSTTSAGTRAYTDFVDGGTAQNQDRRRDYLNVCCDVLVQGLTQVSDEWSVSGNNYRTEWMGISNYLVLRKMINSIRVMSGEELSGERIYTAYDNADQEDEHSCFSDNTHRDIALNAEGIKMLYSGTYVNGSNTVIGYSLNDLVLAINPTLAQEMTALQLTSKNKVAAMYIPFDQAISLPSERPKVLETVYALQAEQAKILEIAALFDIAF